MENENKTLQICIKSKEISRDLATIAPRKIDEALRRAADALVRRTERILEENRADIEAARQSVGEVMLDRLRLSRERVLAMAEGVRAVAALPSPIGEVLAAFDRPNGLHIEKIATPLGVIAVIYESRPNVTSDAAALALKSGSACVLKSGKEALRSARAIVAAMREGLAEAGLPTEAIALVDDPSREGAKTLMHAEGCIDLLIPRGGAGLIRACTEEATVPCIKTGTGVCHIYVDAAADFGKALRILENAKASRPSVCNAAEVCLVHRAIAKDFLPRMAEALGADRARAGLPPVELRLSPEAARIIDGVQAGPEDFDREFLDYVLAVGIVGSVEEAIGHIARHSTGHSEAIVTEDGRAAKLFTDRVDSAAVYVNASTRFTDGGEFGLGCEMGISTQKLHARGPLGVRELMSFKYVIKGDGQVR